MRPSCVTCTSLIGEQPARVPIPWQSRISLRLRRLLSLLIAILEPGTPLLTTPPNSAIKSPLTLSMDLPIRAEPLLKNLPSSPQPLTRPPRCIRSSSESKGPETQELVLRLHLSTSRLLTV